ncbi:MAG: signal peptidase II [Gammaproteobacteria bacterium]|nr:signal peptidase II [Gammaproteobacteria bacterium]NNK98255.1 signal peptidase II [Xanthomonadales bacterium]
MPAQTAQGLSRNLMALIWLLLSALIVVLDLWTKSLATESLSLYRPVEVTSWLNMTLAHNYGAAFSFLSDAGGWQRWLFTGLASIVTVILIVWLLRLPAAEKRTAAALCMIIGGAVGNLVDRMAHGYVVDFIDVYYQNWHWPAFNVADSAITGGVILLLLDSLLQSIAAKRSEKG